MIIDFHLLSTCAQSAVLLLCRTMVFFIRWGNKCAKEGKNVPGKGALKSTAGGAKTGPILIAVNFYLTQFVFKRQLICLPKPFAVFLVPL